MLQSAEDEKSRANSLLSNLQKNLEIIKVNTLDLNNDIASCNSSLQSVREASDGITTTVQEVTKGIVGQAESTVHISGMMSDAEGKMKEVLNYSKQLANISDNASSVIAEGSGKIINMDKQMDIINSSVSESLTTVQELQKKMDQVNTFLTGITQIAEQTNLLH